MNLKARIEKVAEEMDRRDGTSLPRILIKLEEESDTDAMARLGLGDSRPGRFIFMNEVDTRI